MKIAIPKERRAHEARVAASPETVKKLVGLGCEVLVESGAGLRAAFTDEAYQEAGATLVPDAKTALAEAEVVLKVQRPEAEELPLLKSDAMRSWWRSWTPSGPGTTWPPWPRRG
jgi:NAD(P) transhydrogenase subunit alpha